MQQQPVSESEETSCFDGSSSELTKEWDLMFMISFFFFFIRFEYC